MSAERTGNVAYLIAAVVVAGAILVAAYLLLGGALA